ncbi:MAG: hypothetical protein LUI08_06150 [Prevotella sp.]|nr:hypothetical protein [Prevotella sp.]
METGKRNKIIKAAVIGLVIVAMLAVAYLFALNGRYSHIGDTYYFDKWTQKIVVLE